MIDRRNFITAAAAGGFALAGSSRAFAGTQPPNIILIYSDDIGYGDIGSYGAQMVKTPNLDRLAEEGVRFTDAHSTAAVCSPSRYSLLTGQYAFRNRLADHILSGVSPLCIGREEPTLPGLLRSAGYATGLVGKWHLGLGTRENPVDYNADISPGPLDAGFDYAFFMPATGDRVPCVFIENRRVFGFDPADPILVSYGKKIGDEPTGLERPDLLKMKADPGHSGTIVNGISRIGFMEGGRAARWVDEDIADTLTRRAVAFVQQNAGRPFFLYYAPHDIHEPMVPHARFKGTSDCGSRGDAIHQLDWSAGEVLSALDKLGLDDNTLIIFSSDNGGAIKDTYDDGTNHLHPRQPPNGSLRGEKFSLFEGGHRVPLIARWPAKITGGAVSSALIGQVDMLATLCAAAGADLPSGAGPDSINVLPAFLGQDSPRENLVAQLSGPLLAIRQGSWKLIPVSGPAPNLLYNLDEDLAEKHNLALKHPGKVMELTRLLHHIRSSG